MVLKRYSCPNPARVIRRCFCNDAVMPLCAPGVAKGGSRCCCEAVFITS